MAYLDENGNEIAATSKPATVYLDSLGNEIKLAQIDTGRVAPAVQDNTRTPMRPAKRQANLETTANERAAATDYVPSTAEMLFPRVSASRDVDTTKFAAPGLSQKAWAALKDLGSLPGRTVAGAATGAMSTTDVPAGEGSWLQRAGTHAAGEGARMMAAPTNLGNQGGVAGVLESGIKDPLNALLPAGGALAGQLARIPAVARKVAPLKPILTGAAGTEDAAQAADKITHAQAQQELLQRAAAGSKAARDKMLFDDPEFVQGIMDVEGEPGVLPALEGYLSAANRGVAHEVDPLAQKILDAAYTPRKFARFSPDYIAQKLGQLRAVSDATAAGSLPQRAVSGAVKVALPTLNSAVRGGVPGAIYPTLDAALSGDDREANILSNLAAGTALHGGGQLLKSWGTQSFPGASAAVATSRGPSKTVRQTVQQNMDELIGHSALPTLTGTGYKAEAEAKLRELGGQYKQAARQILPSEVIDPAELRKLAEEKLADAAQRGANVYHGPVSVGKPEFPGLEGDGPVIQRALRPEIERVLDDAVASMQGSQHIFATPTNLVPPGTPKKEAKRLLKEYEQNVQAQVDNPSLSANKLLDLRTTWNSPLVYTDPTGSLMQGKKHAYEALHEAANDILASMRTVGGGTYGDILAAQDLPRQYSLWSSFRDVLHSPRAGLQSRVSTSAPLIGPLLGNAALDHYVAPSLKYYGGRVLQRAPGFGHALVQDLNDTTGVH